MADPAAIHAQFIGFKQHQGRGTLQLIIEVDEKEATQTLEYLGIPMSHYPIDVVVAKLKADWEIALERQEAERHAPSSD